MNGLLEKLTATLQLIRAYSLGFVIEHLKLCFATVCAFSMNFVHV